MSSSKPLILITGTTGHLGFRTLVLALQAGYKCRIALRRIEQSEKIKTAASIQPFVDSVEFIQVPDITEDDAFDEAIKGVEGVIHVASPIFDTGSEVEEVRDWEKEMYDPAVKGTLSVLKAAVKTSSVKRVVITSSVVVLESNEEGKPIGPYDIAPVPSESQRAAYTVAQQAYQASKILSHHAATDFMESTSPNPHFDLVRVLPGYVQGGHELAPSLQNFQQGSSEGTIKTALGNVVDRLKPACQVFVDDVARAHVLGLDSGRVKAGQNLVTVGHKGAGWQWDDFVPIIEEMYPGQIEEGILKPRGGQKVFDIVFDVSDTERTLGVEFAGPREMVRSTLDCYLELLGGGT